MTKITEAEVRRLRHDAHIGQELEAWVCMNTAFEGDPPYVGLPGLLLALNEMRDEVRRARHDLASAEHEIELLRRAVDAE